MAFQYKNPTSASIVNAPFSVTRNNDTGTNFSVESVGGYMEVYTLQDLIWTIPEDVIIDGGSVLFSGNSIPISFQYNVPFSIPNTLTLNNDGISIGTLTNIKLYVPDYVAGTTSTAVILGTLFGENLEIRYNKEMPNGQYRKDVSNSKLKSIIKGFKFTSLEDGIKKTYFIND